MVPVTRDQLDQFVTEITHTNEKKKKSSCLQLGTELYSKLTINTTTKEIDILGFTVTTIVFGSTKFFIFI